VPPINYLYYGTKFDTYSLSVGWGFDSRNRALFADRGARHRVNLSYTLPGSDVEFYTVNYDYLQFVPISKWFTLLFNADLGYGFDIGDTTAIPPYRRFFAGGPESVRGFQESRLGPKDSFGNPFGGNLRLVTQTELLLPMPEKWRNSARFSVFFDAGNVFSTDSTQFVGRDRVTPVEYGFDLDEIKYSTGVAVQWLAPLGVFRFSYAYPLNDVKSDGVKYGDETEGFQFSIGQAF
jgi:outer membrane protein insertion porin family